MYRMARIGIDKPFFVWNSMEAPRPPNYSVNKDKPTQM